ncbi:MAG: hypothetical protein KatS3mg034_0393 [Vicingaceae bacterium]|nr:MAG: hypothetical protein KatS3mg034_0393 [Vicingaceae bacterium]
MKREDKAAGLSEYPAATKPGRQQARQPTAGGSPGSYAVRLAEGRGIAAKAVHAPKFKMNIEMILFGRV